MGTAATDTRHALLDAAEELFSAHGYDAVGIRDIANAAATNLASIKYHFGSKKALYLETVNRAMRNREGGSAWDVLTEAETPENAADAAVLLVRFIHALVAQVLAEETIDACGTLIIREGLKPSEALDAVVDHYLRPNQASLVAVLNAIAPQDHPEHSRLVAQSILGQIIHYRVFRPVIERLRGTSLSGERASAQIADHIARFSLAGLGCDSRFVERAICCCNNSKSSLSKEGLN